MTTSPATWNIPLRLFDAAWIKPGMAASKYPAHAASIHVLYFLIDKLGISKYQLGLMLGMGAANYRHVYDYFSGQRQPAPKFLVRGFQLIAMQEAGIPLHRASLVDWTHGFIQWKNGKVSYSDPKTGDWGCIPTPENAEAPRSVYYV